MFRCQESLWRVTNADLGNSDRSCNVTVSHVWSGIDKLETRESVLVSSFQDLLEKVVKLARERKKDLAVLTNYEV
jgi:hypothetical protein